ncbi:hypothetical protein ACOZZ4_004255 [Cronobacter dublinensis]|uniref:hypothetical protein n=1 Tax=Cronobacter dublinensis TaxID=413497 RepID=UPI001376291B|nr:hypothetical protein [Cronobacter dublinensis]ELY4004197.1 hypothetical protein [Cronobacter dublinensis]ELY4409687.1 hypothetical protein [Cronobacter dublinensis]ELY5818494.1 hypothetical protein [Cronobacter dublinensis]NCH05254.1 hypothetical protein [Cronobacter dublinensis]
MPVIQNLPDLSHWKTVQEFSLEQAALLLAGIDPYEYINGLTEVRAYGHERWKLAWGFADGMITAIRRGTLTPVICVGETAYWNDWEQRESKEFTLIKPTDRNSNISKDKTIITRDSLFSWVESERVDIVRTHSSKFKNNGGGAGASLVGNYIDAIPLPEETNKHVLLLPKLEHTSEGLELVKEAIKEFWSTYDEDDISTAPTKQEIIDYLKGRGASSNLADAVDLILRPFSLRTAGRRKGK